MAEVEDGAERRIAEPGAGAGAEPPLVPGYRIGHPIGFGASGATWSAVCERDDRPVIVSILQLPTASAGAAQLRRLGTLRSARHRHLVRVRDVVGLDNDRCALVTDVVTGPSLAAVVNARGQLNTAEVAGLLAEVGSALGYLAERGIVHGDLAPTNILLTPEGTAVLIDLAGNIALEKGTPGFTPPERRGGGPASTAGDVWSLATVVRWAGPSDIVLDRVLAPALVPTPEQRPAARDLAARAFEIDHPAPVTLPTSPDLAAAQLRVEAGQTATVVARATRAKRTPTRRGLLWRLAAAGVVIAAAIAAVALTGSAGADMGRNLNADGVAYAMKTGPASAAHAAPSPPPVEQVITDLVADRDEAITVGDWQALLDLSVPQSPARTADEELVDVLISDSATGVAATTTIDHVESLALEPSRISAAVDLVAHGASGHQPRCVVIHAELSDQTWQVSQTEPCP